MGWQFEDELGSRKGHLSKMRETVARLFAKEKNPMTWGEIDGVRKW